MEEYTRTDLACECGVKEREGLPPEIYREEREGDMLITRLHIEGEEQSALFGKPRGHYVTVMCGKMWLMGEEEVEELTSLLAREIRAFARDMTGKSLDRSFGVLVAGLGNAEITSDAIGPRAVSQLNVTRHLRGVNEALYDTVGRCEISALFPGVLGQTGIETVELVRGAAENARPDLVVVIDALAARSCERLATTV